MNDERPIVYIPRAIIHIDENKQFYTLAYFVSKAHLKSKKTIHHTTKCKSYEYEVDCDKFFPEYPGFDYFDGFPNWFISTPIKTDFITKDFKSCRLYVDKKNKELLEEFPEITNSNIIKKVQGLEVFNIPKEERLGIEETKKDL